MVCLNHSFPPPAIPPSLHQKPCRYLTPTLFARTQLFIHLVFYCSAAAAATA